MAGSGGRLCSLVAGAAQERLELILDGPLEDEPRAQPAELAETVGLLEPIEQGGLDRGLDLDAGGYSSIHGVVYSANFLGPLWSLRRLHFHNGVRTPPSSVGGREPRRERHLSISTATKATLDATRTIASCPAVSASVTKTGWRPGT